MIDKRINYKDIKGQKHMLAYITPGEAKTLEKLGGQKTMTPEGIPAYPPSNDARGESRGRGPEAGNSGREGGAEQNRNAPTPTKTTTPTTTRHNPNTDDGYSTTSTPDTTTTTTTTPNFSIHDVGSTNQVPIKKPTTVLPVAKEAIDYSIGPVSGVDYRYVQDPNSQFNKNTLLNQKLLDTPYKGINTPFMSLNFLGNTIGKFGYDTNTKFFSDNSIGGKINPATNEPFGYGIDGFKAYMEQRALGNVGAYGGTELSQNALNGREGGDDGIMSVYNNPNDTDVEDVDGDGDVDETDKFIFRYFDESGESLQAGAGGVEDLMAQIRKRLSNIFTT